MQYRPARTNVADMLSRYPDFEPVAQAQLNVATRSGKQTAPKQTKKLRKTLNREASASQNEEELLSDMILEAQNHDP